MLVYIVIVCIVFLALRDFGGRRFISTVLLLLYYYRQRILRLFQLAATTALRFYV